MGAALREIVTYDVIHGNWKEIRKFVEVANPENRTIGKIRKEDDDELVPKHPSELTDAKTWYNTATDSNKKHILEDAEVSEEPVRVPHSQELPPELRDKVGDDYDYLTDNEKLKRLEGVGIARKKFPPDTFDELPEDARAKLSLLFEEERKLTPTKQWPIVGDMPDMVFDTFFDYLIRLQQTTTRPIMGEPKQTVRSIQFEKKVEQELYKLGAKGVRVQKIGPYQAQITATLKDENDANVLENRLKEWAVGEFPIIIGVDGRDVSITDTSGKWEVPVNPTFYDKLLDVRNQMMQEYEGKLGTPQPILPETTDPRTIPGAVVLNTETGEQGLVKIMSGQSVEVKNLYTYEEERWSLSKVKLLREGVPKEGPPKRRYKP